MLLGFSLHKPNMASSDNRSFALWAKGSDQCTNFKDMCPYVCFVSQVGKTYKHAWCCAHKINQLIVGM